MLADIPSANDIRDTLDNLTDLGKWREFTSEAIGRHIRENVKELKEGETIRFEFPLLRDMGKYRTLWNAHYGDFIDELRALGYVCNRPSITTDTMLDISLGKPD